MDDERELIGTLTLPGVERSVAYARKFCRDMLGGGHPVLDDVQTCVSEAFTNGVVHSRSGEGGKVTVALLAGPGLVVAEVVDDGGRGVPCVRDEGQAESGRGLRIIDALSVRWSAGEREGHTVVRMEFGCALPQGAATSR
ncbi:ATP-binding protein [Actinocorallia longicatena]|uniref:Histidine kinase/HSP90-like ATPase domain-containing protein n=1 Tax=Actinocorallia longicatena TaxID=111803 RepID=A0ABP6QBC7_9ACTN